MNTLMIEAIGAMGASHPTIISSLHFPLLCAHLHSILRSRYSTGRHVLEKSPLQRHIDALHNATW